MTDYAKNPGKPELMDAVKRWLQKHGGTGVFVKTKPGGEHFDYVGGARVFIAAGEVAPFMTTTINQLVESGAATRSGNRVTLI